MPAYPQYEMLDAPAIPDGDRQFFGVNSYLEPEALPIGFVQTAHDMRFDGNRATVRKGWDFLAGTVDVTYSAGTEQIFEAGKYSDPDDGNLDWIVAVMKDKAIIWNEDNPNGLIVNFVSGATSTTTAMDITVVQAFNKVFILRSGEQALVWDGDTTDDSVSGTSDSEFLLIDNVYTPGSGDEFPATGVGIYFNERLIGIQPPNVATPTQTVTGAQTVVMSDLLAPNNITPVDGTYGGGEFYMNQGAADWTVGFSPWLEHQLIVFNRRSIHLISNVHATSIAEKDTVETRYGCVARRSIAQGGGYIFFLSDDGVFTLSSARDSVTGAGLTVSKVQGATTPLSQSIQDEIDALDYTEAVISLACGVVHDNKYYLAIGTDVLIYDILNQAWVSKDTYPEAIINWVVMPYGTSIRLFAIAKTGWYMMEENAGLDDRNREIGSTSSTDTLAISAKLKTRNYHGATTGTKKFPRVRIGADVTTSDAFTVKLNTVDPDRTGTLSSYTATATDDTAIKLRSRLRGYSCNVEVDVTAGSPAFRWIEVDAVTPGGNNQRTVE